MLDLRGKKIVAFLALLPHTSIFLVGCDNPSLVMEKLDNLVVSSDSREIVSPQALQTASVESVGLRYLK